MVAAPRRTALALLCAAAAAFRPAAAPRPTSCLGASRRDVAGLAASLPALALAGPARALNPMTDKGNKNSRYAQEAYEEAPSYLSEPTAEFKQAEKERAAFRAKQGAYKKKFDESLLLFSGAADDATRVTALNTMGKLIVKEQGLPSGLKLTDLITFSRRVKAKAKQIGGWDTPVEIAYMDMIRSVKKAENPNQKEDGFL